MRNTLKLVATAVRYHWDSQRSTPANFYAAVIGMIVNNSLAVAGLWAMLFDGKPDGKALTVYFLALNGVITIAWGGVCFFLGGLYMLAGYVEDGTLEPMLATPRHPLLMVAISRSMTAALGDLVQGLLTLVIVAYLAPWQEALRCLAFTVVSTIAVMGVFIAAGSIPFWVKRGSSLAYSLREINLSLSYYPSGKIFSGMARTVVYLTPALFIGILPIKAIDTGSWESALVATAGAVAFLAMSLLVFKVSLRRYQTSNYVMAR